MKDYPLFFVFYNKEEVAELCEFKLNPGAYIERPIEKEYDLFEK